MKVKATLAALLAALAVGAVVAGPAGAAAKPLVVGTDPVGDWGANADPTLGPLGDPLGQDLVSASVSADSKTANFVIALNSLPPAGGMPEISRYTWDLAVDGKFTELDGKFTNYSRGVCDPNGGACPPPRDPGMQPFFVRGNCTTDSTANITNCQEIGTVQATFDAAAGTITIPVPLSLIKAKPGSKIAPATNIFGGSISASPATYYSESVYPMDTLVVTKTYTVPK